MLHPALADSVDRDSLLRQASELGIHESQANLSLLNLAEATAALSALQRELMALVPGALRAAMVELCAEERTALDDVLLAWQALSARHHARTPDVVADERARRERVLKRLRSAVAANLRSAVSGAHWWVRTTSVTYAGEAAMLITGDWERYADAIARMEPAARAIASALRAPDDADRQAIVKVVPRIIVGQLVRGGSHRPRLSSSSHVLAYGERDPKWFNLVPKVVAAGILHDSGARRVEEPVLSLAIRCLAPPSGRTCIFATSRISRSTTSLTTLGRRSFSNTSITSATLLRFRSTA